MSFGVSKGAGGGGFSAMFFISRGRAVFGCLALFGPRPDRRIRGRDER